MEFVATQPIAESSVAHRRHRSFRSSFIRLWEPWPAVCAHRAVRPLVRALAVSAAFAFLFIAALSFAPDDGTKMVDKTVRVMRSRVVAAPAVALRSRTESGADVPLDSDFSMDQAALTWSHRMRRAGYRDEVDLLGKLRFGPVRVESAIVEHVVEAAKIADMDPALLMAIADKESSFAPKAKASTSSASGLFQFVEAAWFKALRSFGWRHGHEQEAKAIQGDDKETRVAPQKRAELLRLRNDPYLSAVLAAEMLKHDGEGIASRLGRQLTQGETYLIHFLGPEDAERFMKKMDDDPRASAAALLPKAAKANKPIFYERQGRRMKDRSVREVHEAFEAMMDKRTSRYEDVEAKLPAGVSAYTGQ
jgi:Transglycosylase SLT domain